MRAKQDQGQQSVTEGFASRGGVCASGGVVTACASRLTVLHTVLPRSRSSNALYMHRLSRISFMCRAPNVGGGGGGGKVGKEGRGWGLDGRESCIRK